MTSRPELGSRKQEILFENLLDLKCENGGVVRMSVLCESVVCCVCDECGVCVCSGGGKEKEGVREN